jgi:CBS domain-containing protein
MKLSEVMQTKLEIISADASIQEAALRMKERNVGALPVRVGDQLAGIVTDRDIVVRSVARGDDPDEVRVATVMTKDTAYGYIDDSVDEASQIMSKHQIQRLLVLDRSEKLVGIVTLADLSRGNAPVVTRTLEEIKKPTKSSALGSSTTHSH